MFIYEHTHASIGESPIWSDSTKSIVWVDAAGREIYQTSTTTHATHCYTVPFDVTAIVPGENDSWICASKQGLFLLNHQFEVTSKIIDPCSEHAHLHLNDAIASPNGEIWFGTMNSADLDLPDGKLYALREGDLVKLDQALALPMALRLTKSLNVPTALICSRGKCMSISWMTP